MKIENETLDVLKNFSTISEGILIKKGNILRTVSPLKNILAQAEIPNQFPVEFAVYDLSQFISLVSMHKELPEIQFGDNDLTIRGLNGESETFYRYTAKTLLSNLPPDKELELPSKDVTFTLSAEKLENLYRMVGLLGSPQIVIESHDGKIYMHAKDIKNDSVNSGRVHVGESDKDFSVTLRSENLKMISSSYKVTVCLKGMVKFESEKSKVTYWIATEAKSE